MLIFHTSEKEREKERIKSRKKRKGRNKEKINKGSSENNLGKRIKER